MFESLKHISTINNRMPNFPRLIGTRWIVSSCRICSKNWFSGMYFRLNSVFIFKSVFEGQKRFNRRNHVFFNPGFNEVFVN